MSYSAWFSPNYMCPATPHLRTASDHLCATSSLCHVICNIVTHHKPTPGSKQSHSMSRVETSLVSATGSSLFPRRNHMLQHISHITTSSPLSHMSYHNIISTQGRGQEYFLICPNDKSCSSMKFAVRYQAEDCVSVCSGLFEVQS